jgi:hypothetical protein
MQIVVYSNSDNQTCERLSRAIDSVGLVDPPEVHTDVTLFCQRFRSANMRADLTIIMTADQDELDLLVRFRDLFENTRTIVILPERETAVLAKGHKLHPSYMAYRDDDFMELAAIVNHLKIKSDRCACEKKPDVMN